jgi:hypothetical protein
VGPNLHVACSPEIVGLGGAHCQPLDLRPVCTSFTCGTTMSDPLQQIVCSSLSQLTVESTLRRSPPCRTSCPNRPSCLSHKARPLRRPHPLEPSLPRPYVRVVGGLAQYTGRLQQPPANRIYPASTPSNAAPGTSHSITEGVRSLALGGVGGKNPPARWQNAPALILR